jgi:DNA-binding FadR family transcriptional regulator
MRENCRELERAVGKEVEEASRLDLEFHREIARATDNELYLLLLDSIGEALLEIRRENLQSGSAPETLRLHHEIFERIAARDPDGARKAMAQHLDHVEWHWQQTQARGDGDGKL